MDLRSLRHAVVLGRLLSYTKAAEELAMSQPALTRSIQVLEQRAKVRLFDRDRGGVHLTPIGRDFVGRAATILREVEDLDREVGRAAGGAEGKVNYGMAPLPAAALLPSVICEGLSATPELWSRVVVRQAEYLLSSLIADEIEFFVCAEGQIPDTAPVKSAPLGWFETTMLVRAGHPLLCEDWRFNGQSYPLVVAAALTQGQRSALEKLPFIRDGREIVLEDYGALARITQNSDAIWLSSSSMVDAEDINHGVLKELPSALAGQRGRFRMMLYSMDRRSLSPAALHLKARFEQRIREFGASHPG